MLECGLLAAQEMGDHGRIWRGYAQLALTRPALVYSITSVVYHHHGDVAQKSSTVPFSHLHRSLSIFLGGNQKG